MVIYWSCMRYYVTATTMYVKWYMSYNHGHVESLSISCLYLSKGSIVCGGSNHYILGMAHVQGEHLFSLIYFSHNYWNYSLLVGVYGLPHAMI